MIDDSQVLCAGYLHKRLKKTHQWKRVWVVLRGSQLAYYKDLHERKAIKVIPQHDIRLFSRIDDHHRFHFGVYTGTKVIHFRCSNENDLASWLDKLAVVTEEDIDNGSNHFQATNNQSHVSEISEHHSNTSEYIIEKGPLKCLRKRYNQWVRYDTILTNHALYFNKKLQIYKVIPVEEIIDVIEWDCAKGWCLMVITPIKRIRMKVKTEEEMIAWLSALKTVVGGVV